MARTFTCICCRRILPANPRCKNQEYCSRSACQRERKRRWQTRKMITDPDYRENQRAAYKSWCERNPDYWRQRRQAKQRDTAGPPAPIGKITSTGRVKMDAFGQNLYVNSGEYILVPTDVKMDALRVKIIAIAPS